MTPFAFVWSMTRPSGPNWTGDLQQEQFNEVDTLPKGQNVNEVMSNKICRSAMHMTNSPSYTLTRGSFTWSQIVYKILYLAK